MKKFLLLLMAFVLSMACTTMYAQSENNKIYYTTSDGNLLTSTTTTLAVNFWNSVVDNVYENGQGCLTFSQPVTRIDADAFYKCTTLTSITIPESVNEISAGAFLSCSSLTSITIPESVTKIGSRAFNGCSELSKAEFASLESLLSINFYNEWANPLYLAHHLYIDGSEVTDLAIPEGVTNIGQYAFAGCSGLTSLTIPEGVTSIGKYAFAECSGLTSLTIPEGVTSIGEYAFKECSGLTSLVIEGAASIGNYAFGGCVSLKSIEIANGPVFDGWDMFRPDNQYDLPIPDVAIIHRSFKWWSTGGLLITDGQSVEIIPCFPLNVDLREGVEELTIDCYQYEGAAIVNSSLKIPSTIKKIKLVDLRNTEDITILGHPDNVNLQRMSNLSSVTCKGSVPPTLSVSNTNLASATLMVPASSIDAYRADQNWSQFGTILPISGAASLSDGERYFSEETAVGTLVYTRTFENTAWQSMYVPFDIPVSVLEEKGLEVAKIYNVHQYDRDDDGVYEETNIDFLKMKSGTTKANYPYMVRAKEAGDVTIELENVLLHDAEVVSIDCSTVEQLFTFTGTYDGVSGSVMYNNNYYAMNGNGGLQRAANSSVSLKPQRWYLAITNRDGSPVNYFAPNVRITVDGIEEEGFETSIEGINAQPEAESVYTLSGQIVNGEALAPGIYVKGGKKIIVK